jgi:hypothetical protein
LKIVYVQRKPCIRALKQARAWAYYGSPVYFQCKFRFPEIDFQLAGFYQGRKWRRRVFDADVIHYHNEPSGSFLKVRRRHRGAKAIFDFHDISSANRGKLIRLEKRAIKKANGIILVSDNPDYLRLIRDLFGEIGPTFVLKSLVNREFLPKTPSEDPLAQTERSARRLRGWVPS